MMKKIFAVAIGVLTAAILAGCATPAIDKTQFTRPKTVAIMDFPDVMPAATIGIINARWPHIFFLGAADPYFVPAGGYFGAPPVADGTALPTIAGVLAGRQAAALSGHSKTSGGIAGGVMGFAIASVIDAGARETQNKAAGYPALVQTAMPGLDLRSEVLDALRKSLEAKGITVRVLSDSRNLAPRLRWPAADKDGKQIQTGELAGTPPVDADIVAQIAPMAVYASPGPLNNYNSVVGMGLALYEGRTRKFIGWQAFSSEQNKLWYARYDSLVADIGRAAPAQYWALMSLIPQVSDTISGGK